MEALVRLHVAPTIYELLPPLIRSYTYVILALAESVSEDSRDLSDKLLQRVVQQQHHITVPGTPVNDLGAEQSLPHTEAFLEAFKERADPYEQYANRTVGDTQVCIL